MEGLILLVVFAGGILLYFLPLFVAGNRSVVHFPGIAILNLLLGWTLLGWVVALVWAVSSPLDAVGLNRAKARAKARQEPVTPVEALKRLVKPDGRAVAAGDGGPDVAGRNRAGRS